MYKKFLSNQVIIKVGDITKEKTDAIVNAANSTLLGGGGVDGAIHRVGGKDILEECKKIRESDYPNGLPTGKAVITSGGKLLAKYVIHTVGPIYGQENGKEADLLFEAYINCLTLAVDNDLEGISFPSISTGAFYYPKHKAAEISSLAIKDFLQKNTSLKVINLVFFSDSDAKMFLKHNAF